MAITAIPPLSPPSRVGGIDRAATQLAEPAAGTSFAQTVERAVEAVNAAHHEAAQKAGEMAAGVTPIDEALMTMEKADMQFRLLTQVRNKVIDAYREIMRMNF